MLKVIQIIIVAILTASLVFAESQEEFIDSIKIKAEEMIKLQAKDHASDYSYSSYTREDSNLGILYKLTYNYVGSEYLENDKSYFLYFTESGNVVNFEKEPFEKSFLDGLRKAEIDENRKTYDELIEIKDSGELEKRKEKNQEIIRKENLKSSNKSFIIITAILAIIIGIFVWILVKRK